MALELIESEALIVCSTHIPGFVLQCFKVSSIFSPELVQYLSSLPQAVTLQAEHSGHF